MKAGCRANGKRAAGAVGAAVDSFIHSELLFLKLPLLFVTPRLPRRSEWADAHEASAGRLPAARFAAAP